MSLKREISKNSSPAVRLAVISMILCGLIFPLVVTGFARVILPYQADGSMAHLTASNNEARGSYMIAQSFSLPIFFHPRNSSMSASGVDPDITRDHARGQAYAISVATGISVGDLYALIDRNIQGTLWIFGSP